MALTKLTQIQGSIVRELKKILWRLNGDIRGWGVTGEGLEDDTQNIVAAILSRNGKPLVFPSGTYKWTSTTTFDVPAHLIAFGDVTIISKEIKITANENIRFDGLFSFDFDSQKGDSSPSSSFVILAKKEVSISSLEVKNAWKNNAEIVGGTVFTGDNIKSLNAGLGKTSTTLSNIGSGFIVKDFDEVHVSRYRGKNSHQSNLFIWGSDVNKPITMVTLDDISVDGSDGNGVRIQSDDKPDHKAIQYVNGTNITTKDCKSHGIRTNFQNGRITGILAVRCNAATAADCMTSVDISDVTSIDCNEAAIFRFGYGLKHDKINISNYTIINPTTRGWFFAPASGDTQTHLGKLSVSGLRIYIDSFKSRAFEMSGGNDGYNFAETSLHDVEIHGASKGGNYTINVEKFGVVRMSDVNIYESQAGTLAYIRVDAKQAIITSCTGLNKNANDVGRPIVVAGTPTMTNICSNVMPNTSDGFIEYPSGISQRYEYGNMFKNSNTPKTYNISGTVTTKRELVVGNNTTVKELSDVLYSVIKDLSANGYIYHK